MSVLALSDRFEIDDLYNRYLWALDTGDTDAWLQTFVEDAEILEDQPDGSTWRGAGRDDLRAFVQKYHLDPAFPGHQHRETTRVLETGQDLSGDRLGLRSYVFATKSSPDAPANLYWSGYYRDVVVRADGEWLFASRWIAPWKGAVTTGGMVGI